MRSTFTSLAIIALGMAPSASALFTYTRGASCTYTGSAVICPAFDDGSGAGTTISTAYCAPDGVCGDDGAFCSTNEDCYDYCGSDGICGGLDASCDSTLPTSQTSDELAITCNTPAFTCDLAASSCVVSASGAARRMRQARAPKTCEKMGMETCYVTSLGKRRGLGYECVDTQSSLESCGGCDASTGGVDCTAITGASGVECLAGACVIESCEPGFVLSDNTCF